MSNIVDMFWSFRSPYSYLATPGALETAKDFDIDMQLRVVLPKALRTPDFFSGDSVKRVQYILKWDYKRRAELLGMYSDWPTPDPIVQDMETLTIAKDQPLIYRLCYLGVEANRQGSGVEFAYEVSHIIWGGVKDWDQDDHLAKAAERAGLNLAEMDAAIANPESHKQEIEENQKALEAAGHWGVPTFVYNDEPFFGQDRIDSLRFQLENDGLKRQKQAIGI